MYLVLSIAAAVVAVLLTGLGIFGAYMLWSGRNRQLRGALRRWTAFDYAILGVYLIGTLFLLADLIGVLRDREAYPYYHYGYLLSGFVYNLLAGIFLFARLGLTLKLADESSAAQTDGGEASSELALAGDDHHEPKQA